MTNVCLAATKPGSQLRNAQSLPYCSFKFPSLHDERMFARAPDGKWS